MRTIKLYFIRNGTSVANEKGIYCGSTDSPLSEAGKSDLAGLLDQYDYPYVDCVYTSSLSSDIESARILYPGVETSVMDSLRETDFGEFEGRSIEELKSDPNFQKWVAPKGEYLPTGGEHPSDFISRICSAVIRIVRSMMDQGYTSAAIIVHMGVISNVFSTLAYPKSDPYSWTCDPGFGYTAIADPVLFLREPVLEVTAKTPLSEESGPDAPITDWDDSMWDPSWDKELEDN